MVPPLWPQTVCSTSGLWRDMLRGNCCHRKGSVAEGAVQRPGRRAGFLSFRGNILRGAWG